MMNGFFSNLNIEEAHAASNDNVFLFLILILEDCKRRTCLFGRSCIGEHASMKQYHSTIPVASYYSSSEPFLLGKIIMI